MAYTAKKVGNNYEIYQDGNRISTGSASSLVNYGLSESNLGGTVTPPVVNTPPPVATAPTQTPTYTPPATPAPLNTWTDDASYKLYLKQQEDMRIEKARQDAIINAAKNLQTTGAGSTAINNYYKTLAPNDQLLVKDIFGANIKATPTSTPVATPVTNGSIVDYLNSTGQASDFNTRSKLASSNGILNYTGTADQNTRLLNILRAKSTNTTGNSGSGNTTTPTPNNNTSIATQLDQAKTEALRIQDEIAKMNTSVNTQQDNDFKVIDSKMGGTVDESDSSRIIKSILASFEANQQPESNLEQQFQEQRAKLQVGAKEAELANVDAELAKLDSEMTALGETETNRKVSVLQINRRKTQEQINYEKARNELQLKRTGIVNELNLKYSTIDSIMKYAGMDYENAQQDYNTKFAQAVTLTNLIKGVEETAKSEEEARTDNARANLQVMLSTIKGKDYNSLDPATQLDIRNLEMQAGLPSGFMKFVSESVDAPVVSIGSEFTNASGMRQVPIYTKDPTTGVMTAKVITLGTSSTNPSDPTQAEKNREESNDIASAILDFQTQIKNKGWRGVNPDAYAYYKSAILKEYGAAAVLKFDKAIADAGLSVDNG